MHKENACNVFASGKVNIPMCILKWGMAFAVCLLMLLLSAGKQEEDLIVLFDDGLAHKGTSIDGVIVEGKDYDGLRSKAEEIANMKGKNIFIILKYPDWTHLLKTEQLGISFETERAAKDVMSIGRRGSIAQREKERNPETFLDWKNISVKMHYTNNSIKAALNNYAETLPQNAIEGNIYYDEKVGGWHPFSFSKPQDGFLIDQIALHNLVISRVKSGEFGRINAPGQAVKANHEFYKGWVKSFSFLSDIKSSFTDGITADANWIKNVKTAAQKLNGIKIEPGTTFSLNGLLGSRKEKGEWEKSAVVAGDRYQNLPGGGVDQVATALLQATIYAGVDIVQWQPSAFEQPYAEAGLEATISENNADLVIKNNTEYPLIILAKVEEEQNVLNVQLWGQKNPEQVVSELTSTKTAIEKIPEQPIFVTEKDEVFEGKEGYTAETYITIVMTNERRLVKKIKTTHYRPIAKRVLQKD